MTEGHIFDLRDKSGISATEFVNLLMAHPGCWYKVPKSVRADAIWTQRSNMMFDPASFDTYRDGLEGQLYVRRKPVPEGLPVDEESQ